MKNSKMILPDYNGGSIVNLMSSIGKALGWKSQYKELKILPSSKLDTKNILLIVIDGLGYEYLKKKKQSFLYKNMKGKMTSVFPSTTAAGITSFHTGTAPQQHGYTGWYVWLRELGTVTTVLPWVPRLYGGSLGGLEVKKIFLEKPFSEKIKVKTITVYPKELVNSEYNKATMGKIKKYGYKNLKGMIKKIKKSCKGRKQKYIYAYWPGHDTMCHLYGTNHKETHKHFWEIDKEISKLTKIKNTTIIITADHGLTTSKKKDVVDIDKYPQIKECLTMTICGDKRAGYAYVHSGMGKKFESLMKKKLGNKIMIIKSKDAIKKNFFGLGKENPELKHRIGDYVLIPKKNYVIKDSLVTKKKKPFFYGNHGGLSEEEMYVPLIIIQSTLSCI